MKKHHPWYENWLKKKGYTKGEEPLE